MYDYTIVADVRFNNRTPFNRDCHDNTKYIRGGQMKHVWYFFRGLIIVMFSCMAVALFMMLSMVQDMYIAGRDSK